MPTTHTLYPNDLTPSFTAGDTVVIRGHHRTRTLFLKSNMRLIFERTVSDGDPYLDGAKILTGWTFDNAQGAYYVTGETTNNGSTTLPVQDLSEAIVQRPENLWFESVRFKRVATLGELDYGKWYFDYTNGIIWIKDNPTGKLVERSVSSRLIARAGGDAGTGIVIEGGGICQRAANAYNSAGVSLEQMPGVSVTDLWIRQCHAAGINLGDSAVIKRVVAEACGQYGIIADGDGIRVWNSAFNSNNYWREFFIDWATGGSKFSNCNDLEVCYTDFRWNWGNGCWLDTNNGQTAPWHVHHCVFQGNYDCGFVSEINMGGECHTNLAYDNGLYGPGSFVGSAQIWLSNGANTKVYNNRCVVPYVSATQYGNAITIGDVNRSGSPIGDGTYDAFPNQVFANECAWRGPKGIWGVRKAASVTDTNVYTQNVYDYNKLYVDNAANTCFEWGPAGTVRTFTNYQAQSANADAHSTLIAGTLPSWVNDYPRMGSSQERVDWALCR